MQKKKNISARQEGAPKWSEQDYRQWLAENVRVSRPEYLTLLSNFLEGLDGKSTLLLTGPGGLGKTVITEFAGELSTNAEGKKRKDRPKMLRISLDGGYDPKSGAVVDGSIVGFKEQDKIETGERRIWPVILERLTLVICEQDKPGARKKSSAMPVMTDFLDHCTSLEDTKAKRAARRRWMAGFSGFFGILLGVVSALPDIVGGLTGYQISGLAQFGVGLTAVLLILLASRAGISWVAETIVDNGRYTKLGMQPGDYYDPAPGSQHSDKPIITDNELSRVFLFDLERWQRKRHRKRLIVLIIDIHDFIDDDRVRSDLARGIAGFAHQISTLSSAPSKGKVKLLIASKFDPYIWSDGNQKKEDGLVVPVTNLSETDTQRLINTALNALKSLPRKSRPAAVQDGTLGSALSNIGEKVCQELDKDATNSVDLWQVETDRPLLKLFDRLAHGAGHRAVRVRDQLAAFLSDHAAEKSRLDNNLLRRISDDLQARDFSDLVSRFDTEQAWTTACFLAAFRDGLSEADWPVDDRGLNILDFAELEKSSGIFYQTKDSGGFTRASDHRSPPYNDRAERRSRWHVFPSLRRELCEHDANLHVPHVWDLIKGRFGYTLIKLKIDDRKGAPFRADEVRLAQLAFSCLKVAARRQNYFFSHPWPEFNGRVTALLDHALASFCATNENDRLDGVALHHEIAQTCLDILAGPVDGFIDYLDIRRSLLAYLAAYLASLDSESIPVRFRKQSQLVETNLQELVERKGKELRKREHSLSEESGNKTKDPSREEAKNLDVVISCLTELRETGTAAEKELAQIRSNYSVRKLRRLQEQEADFKNALAVLDLDSFNAELKVSYVEILRKMGNSLASNHLDPTARRNTQAGQNLDRARRSELFSNFIRPVLHRIEEIRLGLVDGETTKNGRLLWFRFRMLLYWVGALRDNDDAGKIFEETPGDVLSQLLESIRRLSDYSFAPVAHELAEHVRTASQVLVGLDHADGEVRSALFEIRRNDLERGLERAREVIDAIEDEACDWSTVFTPQIELLARTFLAPGELDCSETSAMKPLRVEARRLYASTLLSHWRARPSNAQNAPAGDLAEQIRIFAETDYLLADVTTSPNGAKYVNPEFAQNLLTVLACLNPPLEKIETGNCLIGRVEKILDRPRIGSDKTEYSVCLSLPNQDGVKLLLPDSLLPSDLFMQVRIRQGRINPEKPRTTRLYDDWKGKLLPLNVRNIDQTHLSHAEIPVSAKGSEHAPVWFQLFCPIRSDWRATSGRNAPDTNRRPFAWLGASNSWLAVRVPPPSRSGLLANKGAIMRQMNFLTAMNRITIFTGVDDDMSLTTERKGEEIRDFLSNAYRDLSYHRTEEGKIVFHFRKSQKVRSSKREAQDLDQDDFDHRKNRTFLKMFDRVFDENASIHGWEDPGRLTDAKPEAAASASKSTPILLKEENDDFADYDVDEAIKVGAK